MAERLLSSNFDIIFLILSLLPTETLLRVQTVCRTWAQVISDPVFIRTHCSLPAPITALLVLRDPFFYNQRDLIPIQEGYKFPSSISDILSSSFEVVSSNHGILCFRHGMVFVVGNPVTSSWSFVRYAHPNFSEYKYHDVALIYEPTISLNFKLVLAWIIFDHSEGNYCIQLHIYSSETCSWTISSLFIEWFVIIGSIYEEIRVMKLEPCKIGGGSVCWIDRFGDLVGYEISTDTCWKTPLPQPCNDAQSECLSSYDNIIYFTKIDDVVAKVWRLEGKDSWVFEGECSSEELRQFVPHPYVYDRARKALLIGDRTNEKLFALHLSSSRLEILSQGVEFPTLFDSTSVAHGNTLAPFRGVETGMDGFARELAH
ncbi:F-box protein [Carex littledalei]|uniref:F-box protein n=1 Tax=Carex littledalei TaxID=544730 RepID=A0A833VYV6_9POAL|nr:F-box protein [Carex littledalei]